MEKTITEITETVKNNSRIRSFEITANNNEVYYLDVSENTEGKIITTNLKSHVMFGLDDVNVLIEILEKLRDYNWEK